MLAATANKRKAAEPAEPAAPAVPASKKRKAVPKIEEAQEDEEEPLRPQKKAKPTPAPRKPKAVPAARKVKFGPSINKAPDAKLDIFVFGEGSSGELGLGSMKVDGKKPIDVKRPRLNEFLGAQNVGVVQIAAGGMHVAVLTYDNKIITWGVNDQGTLGRDTKWEGGLKDIDDDKSDSSDDDDDTGINPLESTPKAIEDEHFPEGTKFVQVAASDSATFALTEDGSVYGWGTFRVSLSSNSIHIN
jgi:regulator of chromosome condensation